MRRPLERRVLCLADAAQVGHVLTQHIKRAVIALAEARASFPPCSSKPATADRRATIIMMVCGTRRLVVPAGRCRCAWCCLSASHQAAD